MRKRKPKGFAGRVKNTCSDCKLSYSNLVRHNCKGQAKDGGIVSQRILKFCPLCRGFTNLVTGLPKHFRLVKSSVIFLEITKGFLTMLHTCFIYQYYQVHKLDHSTSLKLSKTYRSVLMQYHSGSLQQSSAWPKQTLKEQYLGGRTDLLV